MLQTSEDFHREVSRGEQQMAFLAEKLEKHLYENGRISETNIMYAGLEAFRVSIARREISFPRELSTAPNPYGQRVLAAIESDIAAFALDDEEKDFLFGSAIELIARFASIIFQEGYQRKHRMG
jgi:hypothetical protein